ncbi:MAG: hypothetical protein K6T81_07705 [Alicyclobacillus macrosporangiidus]|uniref:hypothetical protein n=1 Tax=Alicyclobacillus macrosporangiidus TaxID=392015 RepID=UPI0026EC4163|nr:hypothetical protein [Alicyclobacillus macrosporangiidus]MCL6598610.1 hypothetical protein [Alicyclobacillus macrosporangiidus]
MKSKTSLRVSLIALVASLLSTVYFGYGYYKHVYLLKLHAPKLMPGMPHGYMASAPMWTHGLWVSALVTFIFTIVAVVLAFLGRPLKTTI